MEQRNLKKLYINRISRQNQIKAVGEYVACSPLRKKEFFFGSGTMSAHPGIRCPHHIECIAPPHLYSIPTAEKRDGEGPRMTAVMAMPVMVQSSATY